MVSVCGVVAVLDDEHTAIIKQLWADVAQKFGVRHIIDDNPFPHITFHVAEKYDFEDIKARLTELIQELSPFTVHTSGLGIFSPGNLPIIYLPVVRNVTLSRIHQQIFECVAPLASNGFDHYRPEVWMPHVSLVYKIPEQKLLLDILAFLSEQDFEWEMPIKTIAVIGDSLDSMRQQLHFDL